MCSAGAFSTASICKEMQVNSCCSHIESCPKKHTPTTKPRRRRVVIITSWLGVCYFSSTDVDGKCLVLAGKFLVAAEELKNQPVTVSATWDATHPTLSQSSIRGFQPHSPWFRAPAAHRPSDPSKSSLHQAPHFWVCTNMCKRTSGECWGGQHLPHTRSATEREWHKFASLRRK